MVWMSARRPATLVSGELCRIEGVLRTSAPEGMRIQKTLAACQAIATTSRTTTHGGSTEEAFAHTSRGGNWLNWLIRDAISDK